MKNKNHFAAVLFILLTVTLGCSTFNPFTNSSSGDNSSASGNKSLTDEAINADIGKEKIGVPECDEILNFFVDHTKSQDEDFVTKAAHEYALNKIRESFKKSLAEHTGDTAAMTKNCREFKQMLDKYKSEADRNANASK